MDGLPQELSMLIAAAAGSFVFAFVRPDRKSFWRSAGNLSIGTMASFFLTPFVCAWRDWTARHEIHATAFLFGLSGFVLCKTVIGAIEQEARTGLGGIVWRAFKRAIGWPDTPSIVRDDKREKEKEDGSDDSLPGPESGS